MQRGRELGGALPPRTRGSCANFPWNAGSGGPFHRVAGAVEPDSFRAAARMVPCSTCGRRTTTSRRNSRRRRSSAPRSRIALASDTGGEVGVDCHHSARSCPLRSVRCLRRVQSTQPAAFIARTLLDPILSAMEEELRRVGIADFYLRRDAPQRVGVAPQRTVRGHICGARV